MYGLLGLLSARLGWDSSAGELRRETEAEGRRIVMAIRMTPAATEVT